MLYPALAFAARAEVAVGSLDEGAILAEELLGRWRANRDAYPASAWAVDLASALDCLGRGAELLEHGWSVRSRTRWLEAVLCLLGDDLEGAAAHFQAIGSRPDEASVYLRAAHGLFNVGRTHEGRDAVAHALAFYRPVAATTYLNEAQMLVGPDFVTNVRST
jgi:peptidoglycan/xylan/chitin deacetylase (PgdA/CDA1 family)